MKKYTSLEAAKKLGVSTRTLERYRSSGKVVPAFKTAGGHSRYTEDQIQRLTNKDKTKELLNKNINSVIHEESELELSLKKDGNLVIKKDFKSILITSEEAKFLKSFLLSMSNLDSKNAK